MTSYALLLRHRSVCSVLGFPKCCIMTLPFVAWVAIAGCVVREERFLLVFSRRDRPRFIAWLCYIYAVELHALGISYVLCLIVSYRLVLTTPTIICLLATVDYFSLIIIWCTGVSGAGAAPLDSAFCAPSTAVFVSAVPPPKHHTQFQIGNWEGLQYA